MNDVIPYFPQKQWYSRRLRVGSYIPRGRHQFRIDADDIATASEVDSPEETSVAHANGADKNATEITTTKVGH